MESAQLNSQPIHVSSNLFIQYPDEKIYVSKQSKGDVTRDDSKRRILAQHSIAMLEQCCNHSKQCRNNVATLFCESSLVASPQNVLDASKYPYGKEFFCYDW